MGDFIARKEKLVEAFIATISDIDSKSCDEIENSLYEIIKKTRGLIHADQYRHTSDKQANSVLLDSPILREDEDNTYANKLKFVNMKRHTENV